MLVRKVELALDCEWQPTVVSVSMSPAQAKDLMGILERGIAIAEGEGEYDVELRLADDAAITVDVSTYMAGQP